MDRDNVTITSIDNINIEFELAGLGSRFLAGALDTLFILVPVIIAFISLGLSTSIFGEGFHNVMLAFAAAIVFLVIWGYHIFFEMVWQGQTPGKKIMGIQVLTTQGHHISLKESLIRNLIRSIDSLPIPFYLLAGLFMGFDDKRQRLGDMAAGTIVVKKSLFTGGSSFGAGWITRLERGEMPHALTLPNGTLDPKRLEIIVGFITRRGLISQPMRGDLAWKIAEPLLKLCGEDPHDYLKAKNKGEMSEALIERIYASMQSQCPSKGEQKLNHWKSFGGKAASLIKDGLHGMKKLTPEELSKLLAMYRQIVSDLARARSKSTDTATLGEINSLAILGNQLLNRPYDSTSDKKIPFIKAFPTTVRKYSSYMILSACLFFVPAAIAFFAIQWHHELAYDLVSESFLDFQPWQEDNMHEVPPITRPVAATGIITNNIQVTFFAFAFGLAAGIGTVYLLIGNGIHLGAICSWLYLQGHGKAFWGWIMPHAGTEILAIILAGGAGLILADAVLRPGNRSLKESIKSAAGKAVTIEIGCMLMLIVAGLIEGFISPSGIGFTARMLWLAFSCVLWGWYFVRGGSKGG